MKVTLVTPPSPYLLDDRSLPWLGPLWVAACLRERGHQVRVLDLAGNPNFVQAARDDASQLGADCYGITATAPDYHLALQIRAAINGTNPGQRIILGGAHATTDPVGCLADGWDAVVAGDGFLAAERALTEDGIISASRRGEIIEELDSLPYPARDLVRLDSYDFRVCGERATSFMTQFGCPMACSFCCGRDLFVYRKLRAMSPRRIIAEMDHVRAEWPSFRAAMLYDDEVNIPPKRAIELCEALAAHPVKWILRGFIKAELFTDAVASAMAEAGFAEVLTGVESGSDRILKRIKKNTTFEVNMDARRRAKRYGIAFKASTMVGLPTETIEDVMDTKRWLLEARPDSFDVTIFQPMLGSPIADRPEQEGQGLFFEGPTMLPYKTTPGQYQARTRTETLSADDLVRLRDEIDRDVRQALGMPALSRSEIYDASMGQRPVLSGL